MSTTTVSVSLHAQQSIVFQFTSAKQTAKGVPLDSDALAKLAAAAPICCALGKLYGDRLDTPTLVRHSIRMDIDGTGDLIGFGSELVDRLIATAGALTENAKKQPPRPWGLVTPDRAALKLLRALSRAYAQCGLTAALDSDQRMTPLPTVPMPVFVDPSLPPKSSIRINADIIAVGHPMHDANVVVVGNRTLLELPISAYPQCPQDIFAAVLRGSAVFSGMADAADAGTLCAQAGGNLVLQGDLALSSGEMSFDG